MRISSRGRYGVRLLIDLAQHAIDSHVTLASVAARQNVPVRYLEQVAIILRRTGFIRSVKGASGGYSLARDPAEIVVGDVLRTLEGDMLIIDPPLPGECETKYAATVRRVVFDKLNKKIAAIIDRETIATLIGADIANESYMYCI
ncbi:MAG: Rrf2 family transcriptional regulator [Spirochaetaceae bacterium]|jgi:Rrf2 family protein|nr:Rrf2 family transcriptional regulator [Spirochaetaceae bacterium]